MARPRVDPARLDRAVEAVAKGMPIAQAVTKFGVGKGTIDRAIAARKAASTPAPPPPAPTPAATASSGASPPPQPGTGLLEGLLAEVDRALADLPDDPEARVIGATLRVVAAGALNVDPAKLPQFAAGVRQLVESLRGMRPPREAPPDAVAEELRRLDGQFRRRVEAYTAHADAVLERRRAELHAWLLPLLPPAHIVELGQRLNHLFDPAEAA